MAEAGRLCVLAEEFQGRIFAKIIVVAGGRPPGKERQCWHIMRVETKQRDLEIGGGSRRGYVRDSPLVCGLQELVVATPYCRFVDARVISEHELK